MSGLFDIALLLAFLAGGMVLAKIRWAPKNHVVDAIVRYVLWALLLSMGFRIGNSPELYKNIGTMGLLAFATALLAVIGSCLAVFGASFFIPGLKRKPLEGRGPNRNEPWPTREKLRGFAAHMKAPLKLLAFVVAGLMVGIVTPSASFDTGKITSWTLDALLFFIGTQFVQSGTSLRKALASPAAIAVPLATIVGTLASSLVLVPLFSLSAGKAMALAGGFGWYSLSGVLISNLGDPTLGSVSFLANMFRESLALLLIPFLGRSSVPAMAVSVGGATAMDVTLPLIEQSAGPWIVPISFMSGALLSLIVPFLVPICFKLG
ncbi:MAG: lysine exporter LysO family protein [Spirochaetales bacterium]|jgi:uncharacterized membrane protein YbjE (DUF340 family)